MNKLMGYLKRSQRGFTLVEMAVVIAIIGVLAAVATPLLVNYLAGAKERAYEADRVIIQEAVDAYAGASNNVRYQGKNQYPIKGQDASTGGLNTWVDGDSSTALTIPENPLRGTLGGNPKWRDTFTTNTTRESPSEENLNAELQALATQTSSSSSSGWYAFKVRRQTTDYAVDTRNFLIDFEKMIAGGTGTNVIAVLKGVPKSASYDNKDGATGSYSWYVDANGKVNSLYVQFPTNGTAQFSGDTANNGSDNRGFISGVYP